jgi:Arc/MetJ family transcription regulator
MRTNIEIDDGLMAEAQKVSGQATKKQTVEEALRLMVRLRRQQKVGAAFGKFRWRGNLARSRKGERGARDRLIVVDSSAVVTSKSENPGLVDLLWMRLPRERPSPGFNWRNSAQGEGPAQNRGAKDR